MSCMTCKFGVRCKFYLNDKPPVIDRHGDTIQCRYLPTYQYKSLHDWCGQFQEKADWDA